MTDKRPKKGESQGRPNDDCLRCGAKCCTYFALPIDTPESRQDFDDIRWYLLHKGVSIFVEDGDWYVQIDRRCKALTRGNLCRIYEDRPRICRKYDDADCEFAVPDGEHELLLETPEECMEYAARMLAKKRTRKKARKRAENGAAAGKTSTRKSKRRERR